MGEGRKEEGKEGRKKWGKEGRKEAAVVNYKNIIIYRYLWNTHCT